MFLRGFYLEIPQQTVFLKKLPQKPINVGMERGVAIIGAQMVRPMMTVTMTNFDGTMLGILGIILANFCLVKPSKFVTVTLIWATS